ncbi:MAG: hypothetical protein GWN18_09920, partial [Thermoplasmata archaeon]|nr:hypothetical protein [Thermoplasmata archaeon]
MDDRVERSTIRALSSTLMAARLVELSTSPSMSWLYFQTPWGSAISSSAIFQLEATDTDLHSDSPMTSSSTLMSGSM